jgi:hypothetical protein
VTIDEDRMHLRARLEELVGMGGADILMDRPPGGWSDLVTNQTLDLRFAAFEARLNAQMDARFAAVDSRFADVEHRMELRFADVDHRFDRFEHELLAQVDRRLRAQTWVTISTIIAAMGILVAAVRF